MGITPLSVHLPCASLLPHEVPQLDSHERFVCGKPRANSDGSSLPHYTKNISANSQQDNNTTTDMFSYFQLYPASLVPSYIYLFSFYTLCDIYSSAPAWYECDLCVITENMWPEIGLFHKCNLKRATSL